MVYTAGNLGKIYCINESSYGVTPGTPTAVQYGGESIEVTPIDNPNMNTEFWPGNRSYANVAYITTRWDTGVKVKSQMRTNTSGYDWRYPFMAGGIGNVSNYIATGPMNTIVPFSMIVAENQGNTINQYLYNGCKVNELVLSVDKPGAPINAESTVFSQYVTMMTSALTVTGLQSKTLGAFQASNPNPVLTWKAPLTLVTSAGTYNVVAQNWKLTIKNNIKRMAGNLQGADAAYYALTEALNEGRREINFEAEIYLDDFSYITQELANTPITSLTTVIDGMTMTLGTGNFDITGSQWPTLKQDVIVYKVPMKFTSLTLQ